MNVNHNVFKGDKITINGAKLSILTPTLEAVQKVGTSLQEYTPHRGGINNQDLD